LAAFGRLSFAAVHGCCVAHTLPTNSSGGLQPHRASPRVEEFATCGGVHRRGVDGRRRRRTDLCLGPRRGQPTRRLTSAQPAFNYTTPGYTVTLQVTDAKGASSTTTVAAELREQLQLHCREPRLRRPEAHAHLHDVGWIKLHLRHTGSPLCSPRFQPSGDRRTVPTFFLTGALESQSVRLPRFASGSSPALVSHVTSSANRICVACRGHPRRAGPLARRPSGRRNGRWACTGGACALE